MVMQTVTAPPRARPFAQSGIPKFFLESRQSSQVWSDDNSDGNQDEKRHDSSQANNGDAIVHSKMEQFDTLGLDLVRFR